MGSRNMAESQALKYLSQIHKASRQIAMHMQQNCRDIGLATTTEGHVLAFVAKYPSKVSTIQHVFGMKASTLTSLLDRLENRGLIQRVPNPDDRRSFRIEITRDGKVLNNKQRKVIDALESKIQSCHTGKDYKGFLKVLAAIADATGIELKK